MKFTPANLVVLLQTLHQVCENESALPIMALLVNHDDQAKTSYRLLPGVELKPSIASLRFLVTQLEAEVIAGKEFSNGPSDISFRLDSASHRYGNPPDQN